MPLMSRNKNNNHFHNRLPSDQYAKKSTTRMGSTPMPGRAGTSTPGMYMGGAPVAQTPGAQPCSLIMQWRILSLGNAPIYYGYLACASRCPFVQILRKNTHQKRPHQQNRGWRRASRGANPCFCQPFLVRIFSNNMDKWTTGSASQPV